MSLPDGTAELLGTLEEVNPTVPDELTLHILRKSGYDCLDPGLVRLISLSAERFVASVLNSAHQNAKIKKLAENKRRSKSSKMSEAEFRHHVVTTEDLATALSEHGVSLRRPPYYVAPGNNQAQQ